MPNFHLPSINLREEQSIASAIGEKGSGRLEARPSSDLGYAGFRGEIIIVLA